MRPLLDFLLVGTHKYDKVGGKKIRQDKISILLKCNDKGKESTYFFDVPR